MNTGTLEPREAPELAKMIANQRAYELSLFATSLDIARHLWRRHRELVESDNFPEPFRSAFEGECDSEVWGEELFQPDYEQYLVASAQESLQQQLSDQQRRDQEMAAKLEQQRTTDEQYLRAEAAERERGETMITQKELIILGIVRAAAKILVSDADIAAKITKGLPVQPGKLSLNVGALQKLNYAERVQQFVELIECSGGAVA